MIVPLEHAQDPSRYGGKAAQLCSALRAGLPVPGGFALASDVSHCIANTGRASTHHAPMMTAFGAGKRPVAVRSSAVGEDSEGASFAGQHATVLGVSTEDELHRAIQRVWLSGQNEAAQNYRKKLGLALEPKMGIVVQHLVQADVAGVLFTRHPVTGADERVIEAAWGLGEVVVSGLVTPDNYRVARGGKVLSQTAGDKDLMLRWTDAGGTTECEVAEDRVSAFCLDPSMLAQLDALATRCEAMFPGGQSA